MSTKDVLHQLINDCGFNAVSLPREDLLPLTTLEGDQKRPLSQVGNISSMLTSKIEVEVPPPKDAVGIYSTTTHKKAIGSTTSLTSMILGKIGFSVKALMQAKKVAKLELSLEKPKIAQVNQDEIVKLLARTCLDPTIERRLVNLRLVRYIVLRSLLATSLRCKALDEKDAEIKLKAEVLIEKNKPTGQTGFSVNIGNDGELVLGGKPDQLFVFGIDYWKLEIEAGHVSVTFKYPVSEPGSFSYMGSPKPKFTEANGLVLQQHVPAEEIVNL